MKEVFIVMIIHERIRQLRQEQHLRQAAFAERIAYSTHSVMEWEKGTNPPGAIVNCTPFVRQYDILSNKWGVLLCQKEVSAQ